MDLNSFIVAVFCLVDDRLRGERIRRRGPAPKLSDAEVLTIEIVGEFLGLDTDRAIRRYFRRHYAEWFPALCEVHRTTFARQAANLSEGQGAPLARAPLFDPPRPCLRALRLDALAGLPVRPRLPLLSLPRRGRFRQGHPPQTDLLRLPYAREGLLAGPHNPFLGSPRQRPRALRAPGDRRVHLGADRRGLQLPLPKTAEELAGMGVELLAPYSSKKRDPHPKKSALLSRLRYRIDTVFSQLTERYSIKRVWARDMWHLASRLLRKVLSHTVAFLLNHRLLGNPPLQLSKLLV